MEKIVSHELVPGGKSINVTNENRILSSRELQLIYLQDLTGKIVSHELVPGGKSINVTNENSIPSIGEAQLIFLPLLWTRNRRNRNFFTSGTGTVTC